MDELKTFIEAIKSLTDIDDKELTDEVLQAMIDNLDQNFSPTLINQSINQIIQNLEDQGTTRAEAADILKTPSGVLQLAGLQRGNQTLVGFSCREIG